MTSASLIVSVLLVFFTVVHASESSTTFPPVTPAKIVGGSYARLGQFPHTLSLQMYGRRCSGWWWQQKCSSYSWSHICTGVLIHPNWALTARHCFKNFARTYRTNLRFEGGAVCFKSGRGQFVRLRSYYIYGLSDLALVRLKSTFNTRSPYISTIAIPPVTTTSLPNCTVAGWGWTVGRRSSGSTCLKFTRADIVPGYRCARPTQRWSLCAQDITRRSTPCKGDSGGPLFCKSAGKWYLLGLTHYGYNGCPTNRAAGYTLVPYFKRLIDAFFRRGY